MKCKHPYCNEDLGDIRGKLFCSTSCRVGYNQNHKDALQRMKWHLDENKKLLNSGMGCVIEEITRELYRIAHRKASY